MNDTTILAPDNPLRRGFLWLWRKSEDSDVFASPDLWKLFCLCLIAANWKETAVHVAGRVKPLTLQAGQFVTGRYALHQRYYARVPKADQKTPRTLWNWLHTLQDMGCVSINSTSKFSIVTVCRWDLYQGNGADVSSRLPAAFQQASTANKEKHVKQKRTSARSDAKASSSHAIPDDLNDLELYRLDEKLCQQWPSLKKALGQANPGVNIMAEIRSAHAWETANPTRRKRNRPRFLHNWCARAQDQRPALAKEGGEHGNWADRF